MNNISLKLKHLKSVRSENCRRLHRENNAMKNSETRKKASETKKKLFLSG